jgi:hypothetical protein
MIVDLLSLIETYKLAFTVTSPQVEMNVESVNNFIDHSNYILNYLGRNSVPASFYRAGVVIKLQHLNDQLNASEVKDELTKIIQEFKDIKSCGIMDTTESLDASQVEILKQIQTKEPSIDTLPEYLTIQSILILDNLAKNGSPSSYVEPLITNLSKIYMELYAANPHGTQTQHYLKIMGANFCSELGRTQAEFTSLFPEYRQAGSQPVLYQGVSYPPFKTINPLNPDENSAFETGGAALKNWKSPILVRNRDIQLGEHS